MLNIKNSLQVNGFRYTEQALMVQGEHQLHLGPERVNPYPPLPSGLKIGSGRY